MINRGLTTDAAQKLLKLHGRNEMPRSKKRSLFLLIVSLLREPMIMLLFACAGIYLFIGKPSDSIFLFVSIFGVLGISLYQEHRSNRAVTALRDLSSPQALVIRDGVEIKIPGTEVVIGDILIV